MITSTEIILYVKSQSLSRDFYSNVLLLQPTLHVPGITEFQLADTIKLGLMPESGIAKIITPVMAHPESGSGIPRCELYLITENPDEYLARCIASGGKLISKVLPRDWGHRVGYAADPDGHILAFATA